jgi:hypothetical protein
LDPEEEFLTSKDGTTCPLQTFHEGRSHVISLDQSLGALDIIVSANHPSMFIDSILLDTIPESEDASVVSTGEHNDLASPSELASTRQSMQIGFSAGVSEADSVEMKTLANQLCVCCFLCNRGS